jgi:hypothetical protein
MTAAVASGIEDQLKSAFENARNTSTKKSYELRFTIDGTKFTTFFTFDSSSENPITNGCISMGFFLESGLTANSPEKGCFLPTLSKETLPKDIKQTDVLQTLSTKLKFAMHPDKTSLTISDVARLINPATGVKYPSSLSLWRLLRGEQTIYEKYGYTSLKLAEIRATLAEATWDMVKTSPVKGYGTLEDFAKREYEGIFEDGKRIIDSMEKISYEDANRATISGIRGEEKTIIDLLATALKVNGSLGLSVHRGSREWSHWDARLRFTSFRLLPSVGRSARKKTRRGRKTRKQQRRR